MEKDDYVKANRVSWNEAASFHEERHQEILKGFSKPGYSHLHDSETYWLNQIGVKGKDIIQLCCNSGSEILSIKNMGAARCVGIDGAGEFLAQARVFANAGGLDCEFVETNVYELREDFNSQFDLCVVTIGVFGWMPDLDSFFKVANRVLKPGGRLFVHEEHPIMNMFEPDDDPHSLRYSYFRSEPFVENDIIVYDGSEPGEGTTRYWFVHTLSDVLSCCITNNLVIDVYREHPVNISSEEFDVYEHQDAQLPLSYILVATKNDR